VKRITSTLIAATFALTAWAQQEITHTTEVLADSAVILTGKPLSAPEELTVVEGEPYLTEGYDESTYEPLPTNLTLYGAPSAFVPTSYRFSGMRSMWCPFGYFGGPTLWNLHEGFNASVDMGVSVGFGKNNPWKGAAFFTNVAGLYAHQFNDRLTVAGGLYLSHYNGWGQGQNAVGLFGLVNYQINNRLDVTGYLAHHFGSFGGYHNDFSTPLLPGFANPSTTIGADLGIRLSEKAKLSIGVSVTREEMDGRFGPGPNNNVVRQTMQDVHRSPER